MVLLMIAVAMTATVSGSAPSEPGSETTHQFLAWCNADLNDCRRYLNKFILSGIDYSLSMSSGRDLKCIPLERNKAADKMLGLMRDPELAEWSVTDGLMESMTEAFPCLTGH